MRQICKRCLYTSDHPLGIIFDREGICSGCRVHEEKDSLDWEERWQDLITLVQPYRNKSNSNYDCIVPVTGAGDSYYLVHIVKNRLGLNPLLVSHNRFFNTPLGIRNLANLRIKFDCDLLQQNVNPKMVKSITRSTLNHQGSVYWPVLAGQTAFPVQTALRFKVPLIIWGAHQGIEQVGMFSHNHNVEMTRRYRKDHDLFKLEAYDLMNSFDTLKETDLYQFLYPSDAELHVAGIRGIYLGNFIRWDPKKQHEKMVETYDYLGANLSRTFDTYDHTDCYVYMGVHDLLKYYKHGYSKVTDHAVREIRHGRLSREEGASLVLHYRKQHAEHVGLFQNWLNISNEGLVFLMNQHRNPSLWKNTGINDWRLIDDPVGHLDRTPNFPSLDFQSHTALKYTEKSDRFVTVGKGHP